MPFGRLHRTLAAAVVATTAASVLGLPDVHADVTEWSREGLARRGFGDGHMRVGLSYDRIGGDHPGPLPGEQRSFGRSRISADLEALGFGGATRHGTLVGAEATVRSGIVTPEQPWVGERTGLRTFFRGDGAIDFAPLHWEGAVAGRVVVGFGAGLDVDLGRWFPAWGRVYPLVVTRLQLFPPHGYGIHVAYKHVPTTSNADVVREHHVDASVSVGRAHLGARCTLLFVRNPDSRSTQLELGGYGAWAF